MTEKVLSTGVAAAYMPLPPCSAAIVQSPIAPVSVTVVWNTVQIVDVCDVRKTLSSESAVAEISNGASVARLSESAANEIVCGALITEIFRKTCPAAT